MMGMRLASEAAFIQTIMAINQPANIPFQIALATVTAAAVLASSSRAC